MPAPTAVRANAERAAQLIRERAQPTPPNGGTPPAESADEELKRLRAENERLTAAHSTLKGKYDAEVPRLHDELKKAKAASGGDPAAPQPAGKASKPEELKTLTDDERHMMGDGYLSVTMKVVREILGSDLPEHLQPLSSKLDYLARMTDAQYRERLAERVPNWQRQNDDPGFYAWLQQIDPATGRLRHDLLKEADDLMQGNRVADIFLAYTERREIGASRTGKQPSPTPPREQLGDPPPAALDVEGKIWTRAQIKQFYAEKKDMDKAEARKIEQDIFAAYNEGRVRD